MADVNKFRLGLFVLAGVLLLIVCIALLGMRDAFVTKGKLVSYMQESVQGLNVGAAVKYKGVPVGSVTGLALQVEDKMIRVDMSVDLRAFASQKSRSLDNLHNFYKFMEREVGSGLRSTVEFAGITGMRYVELNYHEPGGVVIKPERLDHGVFFVPATSSKITDILKLVSGSLEKLSKVDFQGISDKIGDSLLAMKKLLDDPNLRGSIERLERMSTNLDNASGEIAKVLTREKMDELVNNLNSTIKSIDELSNASNTIMHNSKIPETTGALRNASGSIASLEESLKVTLQKLNNAIDTITELTSTLDEDPSSVIRGKQKKPIFPNN